MIPGAVPLRKTLQFVFSWFCDASEVGKKKEVLTLAQALLMLRRCVATEGNLCLHNPLSYDEDGIYLDSLRSAGRGGRSASRARAFAPSGRGHAIGIVDRRPGSPTAPSGSSVSASTQRNP